MQTEMMIKMNDIKADRQNTELRKIMETMNIQHSKEIECMKQIQTKVQKIQNSIENICNELQAKTEYQI